MADVGVPTLILALLVLSKDWICMSSSIRDVVNGGMESGSPVKCVDSSGSHFYFSLTYQNNIFTDLFLPNPNVGVLLLGTSHGLREDPSGGLTAAVRSKDRKFSFFALNISSCNKGLSTIAKLDNLQGSENFDGIVQDSGHSKILPHHPKHSSLAAMDQGTEKLALKKANWEAMTKSYDELEKSIKSVMGSEILQADLDVMKLVSEELIVCHNLLRTIYGPPTFPPKKSLLESLSGRNSNPLDISIKEIAEDYKKSISALVSILYKTTSLPGKYLHLRLSWNNCILQTLDYLRKHKLIPVDISQDLENLSKAPDSLKWIARETQEVFKYDALYWNRFHNALSEFEFLENHPQLCQLFNLFKGKSSIPLKRFISIRFKIADRRGTISSQLDIAIVLFSGLGKKEQDFVLFYRCKLMMMDFYSERFYMFGYDPRKIPTRTLHINFLTKMETLLLQELDHSHSEPQPVTNFLDLKQELMNIRNVFITPILNRENQDEPLHHVARFSYLLLNIVERKFGPNYMEKLGVGLDAHEAVEFRRNFEFMKAVGQMDVWKTLFMDYGWSLLINTTRRREVPQEIWEERRAFYWGKLKESVKSYDSLINREVEKDAAWDGRVARYRPFYLAKKVWDSEIQQLQIYYNYFNILTGWKRGDGLNFPWEFFLPPDTESNLKTLIQIFELESDVL
ncbi:hypothetical protein PGT21_009654 [Puccinia graminis f. sp. tritici]|uniref:Exocyst subunit Exo70 family protein n=1 Tax=Puccinia graminis f. sp. tritici TaxID=56615 RepID=A0A5B0Q2C6_PUCGR|nr:hypothetical protein PGT21_009654 [Puccinia graminis f. sp. tritici]